MSSRLQAEIHRVVNAAVRDAVDLKANPLDSIVLKENAVRITTRRKRHSDLTENGDFELWTEFYMKDGAICAQDGRSADFDVREGVERRYETIKDLLNLSDIYQAAVILVNSL